ncbi:bifunctional glycosyltransferase 87/phosphatase PAP2 family protein [Streptomyces sp. NPDC050516]|uniref:bifunctional glycosyltransferase 87/phosphatase PAP2 family protein n=1 Tax=Streptomyces sp. NPDC050516 TaxID=3365621 RepID=UPI003796BD2B
MANAEHGGGRDSAVDTGTVDPGIRTARVVLWLLAGVLAARQIAAVLSLSPGERLTDLETWTRAGGALQAKGSLYGAGTDHFTGTPFAGLVLKPLAHAAEQALGVGWTFGTLLLVVVLGLVVARALPGPVPRRSSLLAAPVTISLLMVSLPVRNAFHLGQTGIIPVLLVLLGLFVVRGERFCGVLVGLAAALQPTVLLFVPLLWLTGRRRAGAATLATFAAATALAWAALAHDSWTYWVHHVAGAGLGGPADSLANQSLHGALLRLGVHGPLEIVLFLALAAAVITLGLRRAVRYARDGQLLLAVALTGCVAVAVSPTAWQHQLVWVLLAAVGRAGRRAADRKVWPALVILTLTLPADVILPYMAVLQPLRDNLLLIVALAAACAVPFVPRADERFRTPVPATYVKPVPARWARLPLLPFWHRAPTRPNLILELVVIRVGYSGYSSIRSAVGGSRATAEAHGHTVVRLERTLGINIEHWANSGLQHVSWLKSFFDFYYESFHFVIPLAILAVLYVRRPADYRWARAALGFATLLGLVGFWFFPLAPPRLMPGLGFVDTVHGPQDFGKPDYGVMTDVTNQYAAMPSLHFGWALWCGVVIVLCAPKLWMKLLGVLHPLFTVCAILATANHWVLDAVGGAAVVAAGFGLVYVLAGPRRVQLPGLPSPRAATWSGTAMPAGSAGSASGAPK